MKTWHPPVDHCGATISRRALLLAPWLPAACTAPPSVPPKATPAAPAWPALQSGHQLRVLPLPGLQPPVTLWLYLPQGYLASATSWPLVIFLHGSGQRGDRPEDVKAHGPPMRVAQGLDYPFVLCSPQLPAGRWDADRLHALLGALAERLRIDRRRVAATGLSLGGHGVWDWATAYPADLSAIAPVCGFGDAKAVCRAAKVPVRAYHGEIDPVVPVARQRDCIDALRACGGTAEFIVYRGIGHEAWTPAYNDPALVPWLMAQRKADASL